MPLVTGKAGPRNHVLFARQRAYIADYNVSGAVFAPVVRSFLVGVVLDVEQLRVEVYHLIHAGLHRLVATDPGPDPRKWRELLDKWKAENKRR